MKVDTICKSKFQLRSCWRKVYMSTRVGGASLQVLLDLDEHSWSFSWRILLYCTFLMSQKDILGIFSERACSRSDLYGPQCSLICQCHPNNTDMWVSNIWRTPQHPNNTVMWVSKSEEHPNNTDMWVSNIWRTPTLYCFIPLAFQTCHVWPVSSVFGQSSTSESNVSQSDCNFIWFFGRLMLDGGDGCTAVKIVVNWAHHWFCPETTYRAGLILRQSVLQTAVWLFGKESAIPSFIIPN